MAERRAGFSALEGVDSVRLLAAIRRRADEAPPLSHRVIRWTRRFFAPLLVVAAASVLFVARSPVPQGQGDVAVRAKGGPTLHVYRLEGEKSLEAASGSTFAPGDRLRFAVDLPASGDVRVVGVEATGILYTAWPLDVRSATSHSAGSGIELPGAAQLDETTGNESLYLIVCPSRTESALCHAAGAGVAPACPPQCSTDAFALRKSGARQAP
jgi:hypothetical protein